jgi:hypothetical protein
MIDIHIIDLYILSFLFLHVCHKYHELAKELYTRTYTNEKYMPRYTHMSIFFFIHPIVFTVAQGRRWRRVLVCFFFFVMGKAKKNFVLKTLHGRYYCRRYDDVCVYIYFSFFFHFNCCCCLCVCTGMLSVLFLSFFDSMMNILRSLLPFYSVTIHFIHVFLSQYVPYVFFSDWLVTLCICK